MSKKLVSTLKHHSKFFHYYFFTAGFVLLVTFTVYSLLPPKVNAAAATNSQGLVQPILLTIWGFLDR